ncbi:hypothetical protein [Pseudomonas xantholysinigenes]|uniref:Uncharacterized protein n=1 Tax=Pseudomonas xantholysinigenes TaxID=2745490 RepID=A0A9E6Q0X7_9PSED|nr:hypothetical protein [Pseudomonas xantholysinigenes]QXI40428.1 hypothetical protein HU772_010290 [Pseudomonas xantholysinigenes]
MPAPDNLQVQTPGQPITQPEPEQQNEPEFTAKHNGGGRWRIYSTSQDDWFSDFVATGEGAKDAAQAEAERLNAGGTPVTKAPDPAPAPATPGQPITQPAAQVAQDQRAVPVLTPEGWLVPELPINARKE